MKRLVCLLLLVPLVGLLAQNPPPATPRGFRTLGLGVNAGDLCYAIKDKVVPISVAEDTRSVFYEIPAESPVVFFRLANQPDGKTARVPVAEVDLASGGEMPLIVFFPDPKSPKGFLLQVMKEDLRSFPAGTYRILNQTPMEIAAELGGGHFVVPSQSVQLLDKKPPEGGHTLFFQLSTAQRNGRATIYSNNWAFNPLVRTLVVVAPSPDSLRAPAVRRIAESTDFPPPPAPPKTAPSTP